MNFSIIDLNCIRVFAPFRKADTTSPENLDAYGLRPIDDPLVKLGTAHADANAVRETGVHLMRGIDKAYSLEGVTVGFSDIDSQPSQGGKRMRHQSLAAAFVDDGLTRFEDEAIHTYLAKRDRRCQTCGTTTQDYYPSIVFVIRHFHQRSKTSSEQKPGPIAASRL
jgi:hypothetical protein